LIIYRYSIILNGAPTAPTSAVELAVDSHAIRVISAHNFQHCINALWRGYYHIQYYENDTLIVGPYRNLTSTHFIDHFDIERIKGSPPDSFFPPPPPNNFRYLFLVPLYQNLLNLFFTLLFIVLYSITVNTPNNIAKIDFFEGALFAFALGFFFDEVIKMYIPQNRIEVDI
jgi:hypothetical protein